MEFLTPRIRISVVKFWLYEGSSGHISGLGIKIRESSDYRQDMKPLVSFFFFFFLTNNTDEEKKAKDKTL